MHKLIYFLSSNVPYTLYVALHVMIIFASAQVAFHFSSWYFKTKHDNALRLAWASLCVFGFAMFVWATYLLCVAGLTHRTFTPIMAVVDDSMILLACWLGIVSAWALDYEFTHVRMLRCLTWEAALALAAAEVGQVVFGW